MEKDIWVDVKKFLKKSETENFSIEKFYLSKDFVKTQKRLASFNGSYREVDSLTPGWYVRLWDKRKREVVMSDTPMEKESNTEVVENAKGRVLIGGLGLGMILLAIQKKKEVSEIIVIEKYQEIINLVGKSLPLSNKVKIIQGDVLDFPTSDCRLEGQFGFDTIYFDIWNFISSDNWDEMKMLRRRWSRLLTKGGYINSWRKDDCQRRKAEERRENSIWF